MKKRTSTLVLALDLLMVFQAVRAEDADPENAIRSDWGVIPYVNFFRGLGITLEYRGVSLFPAGETSIYASICGDRDSGGYFRNPDGTDFIPGTARDYERGSYERTVFGLSTGISQDLFPGGNIASKETLRVFFLVKYRREQPLPGESVPGSLLFLSDLPERNGTGEVSFHAGATWTGIREHREYGTREGAYAAVSFESAPGLFGISPDFTRVTCTVSGFVPLVERELFSMDIGSRIIADSLCGAYVPIHARTSFGGFNPSATSGLPGLGGGIRGMTMGRFDGLTKCMGNFELRLHFPPFVREKLLPGLILYADAGSRDDLSAVYVSTGMGAWIHNGFLLDFDAILYLQYFVNEAACSCRVEIGSTHF